MFVGWVGSAPRATLGPPKFLHYVNDLPNSVNDETSISIFADDTKMLRTTMTNNKLMNYNMILINYITGV